jgi:hypothetical protein
MARLLSDYLLATREARNVLAQPSFINRKGRHGKGKRAYLNSICV